MASIIDVAVSEVVILIMAIFFSYYATKTFGLLMESEMLLRRYYLWLAHHWMIRWRKKDRKYRWLLKPLGLCLTCCSGWITIFISLLLMFYFKTVLTLFSVFIVIYYVDKHEQNNCN